MTMNSIFKRHYLYLAILSVATFIQMIFIRDVYWDDNCWLLSRYANDSMAGFLDDGFNEMRRTPLGVFYFLYYSVHVLSEHPFLYWNSAALSIQVLSSWAVYALGLKLVPEQRTTALLVAIFYVVMPLDHTMPYLSATNYRLGFLFEITSLLLTYRAVQGHRPVLNLIASVLLSLFAATTLTEAVVAMEPARMLMIWYAFGSNGSLRDRLMRLARYGLVFAIPLLPYVYYRIVYKPYGMYSSVYQANFADLFDLGHHYELLRQLFFGFWRHINSQQNLNPWPIVVLGIGLAIITFFVFIRLKIDAKEAPTLSDNRIAHYKKLALIGIVIVAFQQILFTFAGREFRWGPDSTHGIFMQLGVVIFEAALVMFIHDKLMRSGRLTLLTRYGVAATAALFAYLGVHYNNKNISMFLAGTEKQEQFWNAFTERFPTLPPRATFIFDTYVSSFHDSADMDTGYDIEAYLNLLYAQHAGSDEFHQYSVLAPEEIRQMSIDYEAKTPITRMTRFGLDTIDPNVATIVAYRDGRIYVDKEILTIEPGVKYAPWIHDTGLPTSDGVGTFPYRHKAF